MCCHQRIFPRARGHDASSCWRAHPEDISGDTRLKFKMELLSRETSYTCRTLPYERHRLNRFTFIADAHTGSRQPLSGLPVPYKFAIHPGMMTAAMQGLLPSAQIGLVHRDSRVLSRCLTDTARTPPQSPPKTLTPKVVSKPIKFSIDDILGLKDNADDKDDETAEQRTIATDSDMSDAADVDAESIYQKDLKICVGDDDSSQYSWLQCTRYKPPKLPRKSYFTCNMCAFVANMECLTLF